MIPWLDRRTPFPPVETALAEPDGLLAAGADLSIERLLAAYKQGIFPWFNEGQPILWWSPDPRMVLFPSELHVSRSLNKRLNKPDYEIRFDTAFREVVMACATVSRVGQDGTWITADMLDAYCNLHELGYAHSVETWIDGKLAGAIYGVAIGRMFYGESMFHHVTDASKIALAHLMRYLETHGYGMMDCQMKTGHLASLGAREIPRSEFSRRLEELVHSPREACEWKQSGKWTDRQ